MIEDEPAIYPQLRPIRDTHKGQGCVILGTGATIKDGLPDEVTRNRVVLSCNTILFHPTLAKRVDYYIIQDQGRTHEPHSQANNVKKYDEYRPCIRKYYGIGINRSHCFTPEMAARAGAVHYHVNRQDRWAHDLANEAVGDFGSVIFAVLQFAAWMGFTDWIVAGCDLEGERFDGGCPILRPMLKSWTSQADLIKSKATVRVWRPKGLKGLFDEFTC